MQYFRDFPPARDCALHLVKAFQAELIAPQGDFTPIPYTSYLPKARATTARFTTKANHDKDGSSLLLCC